MAKDEGFDPEGDGPSFRDDSDRSGIPEEQRKAFGRRKRAEETEKARRKKEQEQADAPPTQEALDRGLRAQRHMNATQFREADDFGPNPNWKPPAPGEPGGPPLPRPKKEKPVEDEEQ